MRRFLSRPGCHRFHHRRVDRRPRYRCGHLSFSPGRGSRPSVGHGDSLRTGRTATPGRCLFRRDNRFGRRGRNRSRAVRRDHRRDFRNIAGGKGQRRIFFRQVSRICPGDLVRRGRLLSAGVPAPGRCRIRCLLFFKVVRRGLPGRSSVLRCLLALPCRLFRPRRRRLKTTGLQQREGRGRDDGHPLARQPTFGLLPGSRGPVRGSIGGRGHGTP